MHRFFQEHDIGRDLDVGCGDGRHSVFFAKQGYEMYGLDIAPTGLEHAQACLKKEGLSAETVASDMTSLPWPDGFFDAIISVQALNHNRIREIRKTIRGIWRVLRFNGYLFILLEKEIPVHQDSGGKTCFLVLKVL
ncbi:class I SAM-dependent methyltransferase [Candidatus Hydrogenedentota bacterium]